MKIDPHPYADAWPLLGEDALAELADDIRANGLREPIVTCDGLILDGRNRQAACELADVDPAFVEFEGTDDEALAFVQSVNGARRHQSKGSLAASWALSMLAAGKRSNGRWAYGEANSSDLKIPDSSRSYLGLIADHLPDLLADVRDESTTLNAAYEKARQARDDLEREAKAREFIEAEGPDLAAQVGAHFQSYAEAKAVWEERNRQAAEERREIEKGIKDALNHVSNALQYLDGGADDAQRFIEHNLPKHDEYLHGPRALTQQRLDAGIDFLTELRKARA